MRVGSCQCSKVGETEPFPQAAGSKSQMPPKVRILDIWSRVFFPSPGRSSELGFPPNHMALCLGEARNFPICFSEADFC